MRGIIFGIFLVLCGCSHVRKIGVVGNREFYKVQATSLLGPSVVTIVSMRVGDTNSVNNENAFAGNGLAPAIVGSAGIIAGSALWGKSYSADRVTVVNAPEKLGEPEPITPPTPKPPPPVIGPPENRPLGNPKGPRPPEHRSRVPDLWRKAIERN